MPLGLYISVPFCRTKCSYCNFASGVFTRAIFQPYVDRLCADLQNGSVIAAEAGGRCQRSVDSIYWGGGTPTLLDTTQLEQIFSSIRENFDVERDCEITVECAPGTLTPAMISVLQRCGVNRVSLGVQSFVDREASAVGRQHKRTTVLDDITRLRAAGVRNISVDLIAGLPHQTRDSWLTSLDCLISAELPHASVYMLEVDEDSRLGRELTAGGVRYHAHSVPDEDLIAELYESARERLNAAGIGQYEISNFARDGWESRHNLKYWTRQPYFGVGVDAHSMLRSNESGVDAVRFSMSDALERYVAGDSYHPRKISGREALEEAFFLGLRLECGVNLRSVEEEFSGNALSELLAPIADCIADGLIERQGDVIRLTTRGRLISNDVFERFIGAPQEAGRG